MLPYGQVLASPELLNVPGRVDWREVKQTREEETDASIALRAAFKDFDFTLADEDSD